MTSFKIGMTSIAVIALAYVVLDYVVAKQKIEKLSLELQLTSNKLQEQNEAVKAMSIDLEAYKSKKPKIIEKTVTKYQTIKAKDETCESYMAAIYEAQEKFFKRNIVENSNNK